MMATTQTSSSSIDIIPNETLSAVLSSIPYSRRRYGELRSVNRRFRDVIDAPAFYTEVASIQFPEQIALIGQNVITQLRELDDLAKYEAQLARAVQIYANTRSAMHTKTSATPPPPSKTLKKFLSCGLRLLDYIATVSEGDENHRFSVILGHGVLDPGMCILLRTTIGRMYNYVKARVGQQLDFSRAFSHISTLRNCGMPAIRTQVDRILDFACRRSFERAMLCVDWSSAPDDLCHPSSALFNGLMREVVLDEYEIERQKLASSLICATPLGELLSVMDPSARDDEPLKTVEWRILSRDIDLSDDAFADTHSDIRSNPLVVAEFMHQRMCDVLEEDAVNDGQQAKSISEVDWSEVGETVRKCAEEVYLTVEMENLEVS